MIALIHAILKSILVMLFSFVLTTYGLVYAVVEGSPVTSIVKEISNVE